MWLGLGIAGVFGLVSFLAMLRERFEGPWFLRPVPVLGFGRPCSSGRLVGNGKVATINLAYGQNPAFPEVVC